MMFNAEKLLGKIVGDVVSSSGSWGSGNKSVLGSLGAGSGLMTVIGLGVGAYEILKQQEQKNQGGSVSPPPPPGPGPFAPDGPPSPPPCTAQSVPSSPPPLPGSSGSPAVGPDSVPPPPGNPSGAELAIRMIQVMVAAAHADGIMDAKEEKAVLDRLRISELDQEEKMFLLGELHQPKSIEVLTAGISDPAVAKTMYMLAIAAIDLDTETERVWLNELAGKLGISKEIQSFIEEQS